MVKNSSSIDERQRGDSTLYAQTTNILSLVMISHVSKNILAENKLYFAGANDIVLHFSCIRSMLLATQRWLIVVVDREKWRVRDREVSLRVGRFVSRIRHADCSDL